MTDDAPTEQPASPEPERLADRELFTIKVRRSTLYVVAALAIGFLGGFWLNEVVDQDIVVPSTANLGAQASAAPVQTNVKPSLDGRPFKGPQDAKVTVVEYTDYQCPFCKRHFDDVLPALLKQYGDDVRYVIKNLPVAQIHPFAQKAAEAAECAGEQDAFWEMHDRLFEHQDELTVPDLKEHARAIDLDGQDFDDCLDDGDTAKAVQKDADEAAGFGMTGTPTFVINGTVYRGAANLVAFQSRIDAALKA